jgi:hypothetical protein
MQLTTLIDNLQVTACQWTGYMCVCARAHVCVHTGMYPCMCACVYAYMMCMERCVVCVCMCVCISVCCVCMCLCLYVCLLRMNLAAMVCKIMATLKTECEWVP